MQRAIRTTLARLAVPGTTLAVFISVLVLPVSPAHARNERNERDRWRKPVVSDIDVTYTVGRHRDKVRLEPGETISVPPEETVYLELTGLDQYGREFPRDLYVLRVEADRDASRLAEIVPGEDGQTVRVSAGKRPGKLSVRFWVPGNLNVDRVVEMQILSPAREDRVERGRGRHTHGQSAYIATCLYRALLDRDPDPTGLRAATVEIEEGRLDDQINALLGSPGFTERRRKVSAEEMLNDFYEGFFGRKVDRDGTRAYLPLVKQGRYKSVILSLLDSPEHKRRVLEH